MALVVKNPPANAGDVRDAGLIPGLLFQPLHTFASPPQPVLAFLASVLASFASTGSCILPSPTNPLTMGVCAWHPLAACSAPAPMGQPKASFTCPARKVCAGRLPWGLGRLGLAFLYSYASLCSTQGPPLRHLRLQPLHKHGLWEASSAATGGHRGHGLRGLWHHWHQPHTAGGQPCHWRPGTCAHIGQLPKGPTTAGLRTTTSAGPPAQLLTSTLSSLTTHLAQTGPPQAPGTSFLFRMEQGQAFRITQESGYRGT